MGKEQPGAPHVIPSLYSRLRRLNFGQSSRFFFTCQDHANPSPCYSDTLNDFLSISTVTISFGFRLAPAAHIQPNPRRSLNPHSLSLCYDAPSLAPSASHPFSTLLFPPPSPTPPHPFPRPLTSRTPSLRRLYNRRLSGWRLCRAQPEGRLLLLPCRRGPSRPRRCMHWSHERRLRTCDGHPPEHHRFHWLLQRSPRAPRRRFLSHPRPGRRRHHPVLVSNRQHIAILNTILSTILNTILILKRSRVNHSRSHTPQDLLVREWPRRGLHVPDDVHDGYEGQLAGR